MWMMRYDKRGIVQLESTGKFPFLHSTSLIWEKDHTRSDTIDYTLSFTLVEYHCAYIDCRKHWHSKTSDLETTLAQRWMPVGCACGWGVGSILNVALFINCSIALPQSQVVPTGSKYFSSLVSPGATELLCFRPCSKSFLDSTRSVTV